ncbi:MAG: hypothetical protein LBG72_07080 [Spirochaetaceae bacterium]|jgi:hypothetical protein|nr:hypothetical protein [Spirochaetaceae bacterium]
MLVAATLSGGSETEQSDEFASHAMEILSSSNNGTLIRNFTYLFKKKCPGVKVTWYNYCAIDFTFEGRRYRLNMDFMTGADNYYRYMGVRSCKDITPKK